MSKKIDGARKRLNKALKEHAESVGGSTVSLKKSQRAAAAVLQAALDYAAVVSAKTGQPSPFDGLTDADRLDDSSIASLKKERQKLKEKPDAHGKARAS
jgi:hypothetical protein